MDNEYVENGFIVDLTHALKISTIIYELSRVLAMPEAKGKSFCLKLGSISLSQNELESIKTLIELTESNLAYISTNSQQTLDSANALGIKISEFTSEMSAPTFQNDNPEVEKALNHIFGENETLETTQISEQPNEVVTVAKNSEDIDAPVVEEDKTNSEEEVNARNEIENLPTLYVKKTIRSGQSISSDGNLLIVGDVNPGAEIIAKGDITVWGILSGIAHAGSDGNNYARIRALKLNPVQIRIGDIFARRPDTVNVPFVQKSSEYTPEEAFTCKGTIVIKKIHNEN